MVNQRWTPSVELWGDETAATTRQPDLLDESPFASAVVVDNTSEALHGVERKSLVAPTLAPRTTKAKFFWLGVVLIIVIGAIIVTGIVCGTGGCKKSVDHQTPSTGTTDAGSSTWADNSATNPPAENIFDKPTAPSQVTYPDPGTSVAPDATASPLTSRPTDKPLTEGEAEITLPPSSIVASETEGTTSDGDEESAQDTVTIEPSVSPPTLSASDGDDETATTDPGALTLSTPGPTAAPTLPPTQASLALDFSNTSTFDPIITAAPVATLSPADVRLAINVTNTYVNLFFKAGQNITFPISQKDFRELVAQIEKYFFKVLSKRYPSVASLRAENVSWPADNYGTYHLEQGFPYEFRFDVFAAFPFGCTDHLVLPTEPEIFLTLANAKWRGFVEEHTGPLSGNVFQKASWLPKYSQSSRGDVYWPGSSVTYSSSATSINAVGANTVISIIVKDSFLDFRFYGSVKARLPTEQEGAGIKRQLDILYTELLFNATDNPISARVTLENVKFCLDSNTAFSATGYQLRMMFDVNAEFDVGCRNMTTKEEIISTLRNFDMDRLLQHYVWNSEPIETNLFHSAEVAVYNSTRQCSLSPSITSLNSSLVDSLPTDGALPSVAIKDIFLEVGFEQTTYLRELVQEELASLAKQTELFLTEALGKAYDFPLFFLRFQIYNVNWCYVEPEDNFPLRLHFDCVSNFDFGMDLPSEDEAFAVMKNALASPYNFTQFNADYVSKIDGPANSYDSHTYQAYYGDRPTNLFRGANRARLGRQSNNRCGLYGY